MPGWTRATPSACARIAPMLVEATETAALPELFGYAMLRERVDAGTGRRQQPAVRRRSAGRGAGAGDAPHRPGRGPRRRRDRPRRSRRGLARLRAVDAWQRPGRTGKPGADPGHGWRRADPEHRRLRRGGARARACSGGLRSRQRPLHATGRGRLRLRLPRLAVQARTRPLRGERGGVLACRAHSCRGWAMPASRTNCARWASTAARAPRRWPKR